MIKSYGIRCSMRSQKQNYAFFQSGTEFIQRNRRLITIDLEPHDKNDSGSKSVATVLDSPCTKLTSVIPMSPPDTSAVEQTANKQVIKLQCYIDCFLKRNIHTCRNIQLLFRERNKDACRLFQMFRPMFSHLQLDTFIIFKHCSITCS